MSEINLDKLLKAQSVFERFRIDMRNDRDQSGAVQAFEFCYELAWKTTKRILEKQGYQVTSPKDAFRKAAVAQLIEDSEIWFKFQDTRNITVHTYEQENLEAVVAIFDSFSKELTKLISNLQKTL